MPHRIRAYELKRTRMVGKLGDPSLSVWSAEGFNSFSVDSVESDLGLPPISLMTQDGQLIISPKTGYFISVDSSNGSVNWSIEPPSSEEVLGKGKILSLSNKLPYYSNGDIYLGIIHAKTTKPAGLAKVNNCGDIRVIENKFINDVSFNMGIKGVSISTGDFRTNISMNGHVKYSDCTRVIASDDDFVACVAGISRGDVRIDYLHSVNGESEFSSIKLLDLIDTEESENTKVLDNVIGLGDGYILAQFERSNTVNNRRFLDEFYLINLAKSEMTSKVIVERDPDKSIQGSKMIPYVGVNGTVVVQTGAEYLGLNIEGINSIPRGPYRGIETMSRQVEKGKYLNLNVR